MERSPARPVLPPGDLEAILADGPWQELAGARLFITGGTGFFGTWLLAVLDAAQARFHLNLSATVLTRDRRGSLERLPHLAGAPWLSWLEGDVRTLEPGSGDFTHLLHLATPSSTGFHATAAADMLEILVDGTRRVLAFAAQAGVQRALLASSGAVYGAQPPGLDRLAETYAGGPDCLDPHATYGEGKRVAEHLFALQGARTGMAAVTARCFAFVGPHLPLDEHFAAGNFIADGLAGRPITVRGDGRPWRSYMYPTDLVTWLVTLLLRGEGNRAYNVGSEVGLPLGELAGLVGAMTGCPVQVLGRPGAGPAPRYVPSTARARTELGLELRVGLEEALARTLAWHRG